MAKGAIKYNDLYAADVQAGLKDLLQQAELLDSTFQSLAKTILNSKTRISISIKDQSTELKRTKADLDGIDIAARGAEETLTKLSRAVDEQASKSRNLRDQQEGLTRVFKLSEASVDEIKTRISELTKEYNALGRATDDERNKAASLAKEIKNLKSEQDNLIGTLKKGKEAMQAADGSYNQASQRLATLRKELRELPNAINKTNSEWNKANPTVTKLLKEIEKLDSNT